MKFSPRTTSRGHISSSRKAVSAAGMAVYVEVDNAQGMAALTLRSAGLSASVQLTADEALAIAAELLHAATAIGADSAINPQLPDVRESSFGEFLAARKDTLS